jgi:antirestriction protein ArdC
MPNPPVFEQSGKACYSPSNDVVGMPVRGLFHSSEECYTTEFHELAHGTGHATGEEFDSYLSRRSAVFSPTIRIVTPVTLPTISACDG